MTSDLEYRIGFDLLRRGNPAGEGIQRLLDAFGSLEEAWNASESELVIAGLPANMATEIVAERDAVDPRSALNRMRELKIDAIPHGAPEYPEQLAALDDPPNILYTLGALQPEYLNGISIVGTRRCSPYGLRVAELLATGLAENGVAVISDLERGIDSVAARTAFGAGGHVVAVMAGGLDRFHPAASRNLARDIVASGRGCVVSEQPPGQAPIGAAMRQRNRITSALGRGLLVVEAPKRSGTMYSVRHALDRGCQVYAVPGKATSKQSQGTNWLIQQGAKPVTRVGDILEDLDIAWKDLNASDPEPRPRDADDAPDVSDGSSIGDFAPGARSQTRESWVLQATETDQERAIAELLHKSGEPRGIDEICRECGFAVDIAGATLSIMEVRGLVRRVGTRYALASNREPAIAPHLV